VTLAAVYSSLASRVLGRSIRGGQCSSEVRVAYVIEVLNARWNVMFAVLCSLRCATC
jgi:hypothetical protein